MDKYKKRVIIFLVVLILGYFFVSITIGPPTGKVIVESSMSLVNSMIPILIQNIPAQSWYEDTSLTLNLTYYFNDTNDINFSATSVENIAILINNETNITTFTPEANFHGDREITFTATDGYESTNSNQFTLTVNQVPDIDDNEFNDENSQTTNFSAYNSTQLQNLSNFTIDKPNIGMIKFIFNVNISDNINLSRDVNISQNYIFINSTSITNLNVSANLTLYGLTFTNPKILRDGSDCPASICQKINYSGGTLEFNVTQFSGYSGADGAGGGGGAAGGGGTSRALEKAKFPEKIPIRPIKKSGMLFDVLLTIPEKYKELLAGEEIIGEIKIINMKYMGMVDVQVEYAIQDVNENVLYKEFETKSIEHEIIYVKKIEIPKTIPKDTYLFLVTVKYKDDLALSGYPFKIQEKPLYEKNYLIITYSIISIFTLIVFILIYYYYYKRLEKRIIIKLNEKDLRKFIKNG